MTLTSYHVRPIEGSLDDYLSIAAEALLNSDLKVWQKYVDRVGRENFRGVYDGSKIVGGLAAYRMSQSFGGNEIASSGLSAVAISPAHRGSGACATLLRCILEELRAQDVPLASLYASTQRLYRTVGFEQAGTQCHYSIPISSIATTDRSLPIHRFQSPPIDKLNLVARARAAQTNGNLTRTEGLWLRLLDPYDGLGTVTYLFGDLDAPEGYAILKNGSRAAGVPQPLVSTDVAALTPAALRRLLVLIRDHRSMCNSFEWFGPPNDPLIFLADEQWVEVKLLMRWMLRIVDLPNALSQRGYCPLLDGTLHLDIDDELLPENSGRWLLRFEAGKAVVTSGGEGHLKMNIRALAPLFSGFYSAQQLIRMGAIDANHLQQAKLATAAFAGSAPWLPELY